MKFRIKRLFIGCWALMILGVLYLEFKAIQAHEFEIVDCRSGQVLSVLPAYGASLEGVIGRDGDGSNFMTIQRSFFNRPILRLRNRHGKVTRKKTFGLGRLTYQTCSVLSISPDGAWGLLMDNQRPKTSPVCFASIEGMPTDVLNYIPNVEYSLWQRDVAWLANGNAVCRIMNPKTMKYEFVFWRADAGQWETCKEKPWSRNPLYRDLAAHDQFRYVALMSQDDELLVFNEQLQEILRIAIPRPWPATPTFDSYSVQVGWNSDTTVCLWNYHDNRWSLYDIRSGEKVDSGRLSPAQEVRILNYIGWNLFFVKLASKEVCLYNIKTNETIPVKSRGCFYTKMTWPYLVFQR